MPSDSEQIYAESLGNEDDLTMPHDLTTPPVPGGCRNCRDLWLDIRNMQQQLVAAKRFKEFVHEYLDQHGVPHGDPDNLHQKEGCRIGARLDLLLGEVRRLRAENAILRASVQHRCNDPECNSCMCDAAVALKDAALAAKEPTP